MTFPVFFPVLFPRIFPRTFIIIIFSRTFFLVVVQNVGWVYVLATECDRRSREPNVAGDIFHNPSLYVIANYPDRWRYYLVIC